MSLSIPAELLQAGPHTEFHRLSSECFYMTTPPQGGSVYFESDNAGRSVWTDFDFVTAEVFHKSHDVLVLLFTFRDQENRSITFHLGVLPNVKTVICLPLSHLNGEKLFLDRYPGIMQSVMRGDAHVDRSSINRMTIATIPSITDRRIEFAGLSLTRSIPLFDYDPMPYINELGQLASKDWIGKMEDPQQMVRKLTEERLLAGVADSRGSEYGRYGGWKRMEFAATGFFRTEHDGSRWWFVDPDGYALFSTGMDCIAPASPMRVSGMEHLTPQLPGSDGLYQEAWSQGGREFSFEIANLIRSFGSQWRQTWQQLTECRLIKWGFNTIGNWSDSDFIRNSKLPYVYPLESFPVTELTIFRDFPDVFSPEYERSAESFADQLRVLREDRRMVGYFMRNEPHWAFVDSLNLTHQMLQSPVRYASKERFVQWLEDRYRTVQSLNKAWGSSYKSLESLYLAETAVEHRSSAREADYAEFNRILIRRYVEVPARLCKLADPDHLNLGMRYAWVGSDDVLEGCEWFDVFSLNCYQFSPDREQIEHISKVLNKPVMIGEYHFGAADAGMLAYGIRAVGTQEERGQAYRYYVEQAAAIPELIGVHYFQWNDQPVLGRFDGENYQIGVVDVCNQPYQPFVEGVKQAHSNMYEVRTGQAEPYDVLPIEIPKTGF